MCETSRKISLIKLRLEIERREEANQIAPFPVYDTEIINDLKKLEMIKKNEKYNNEKVHYCKTCLSLGLKTTEIPQDGEMTGITYCISCGNTDIDSTHISEWEDIYAEKYGDKFLKKEEE